MSLNATQPSQQQPLTYVELIQQNGGQHTLAMWLIMGEKCALSSIGILFNAILVAATLKSKNLRSMCNLLIASDSAFLALYQLNALIFFLLPIFGTIFVPFWLCFWLQLVPYFGVSMSFSLTFQIGLERLTNVLFPIWSKNGNSKRFHAILLLLSVVSNCYLIWLQYEMVDGNNSMVFCTASSVSALGGLFHTIAFNRAIILHILLVVIYIAIYVILKFKKENQHFSKSIFRSLLFVVVLEMIGWFPTIFLLPFLNSAQFSPITTTYISTGFTTVSSCIMASANAPTLYYFSHLYRVEINALLVSIGIKKSAGTVQQQQQNTNPRIPLNVVTKNQQLDRLKSQTK
ncbi:hypothetical protein niasHT_012556 [Heterodera trifolii]|uniref:G-protein coupled receptors family 1 profile domain-containing protein n=1 Tax=Heterodera trifolii TaxID=157864 RepID=A0ABD2L1P2_9BILA